VKRWAKNLFCIFSLLVFVGSVMLWVRSYFVGDGIYWFGGDADGEFDRLGMESARGTIGVSRLKITHTARAGRPAKLYRMRWEPRRNLIASRRAIKDINLQCLEFQLIHAVMNNQGESLSDDRLIVPLWLFLPAAIPPLMWLRRWRNGRGRGFPVALSSVAEP
jgi:hypothetical protein